MKEEQVLLYPTPQLKYIITNAKVKKPFENVSVKKLHQLFATQDGSKVKWVEVPTEEIDQEQ